MITLEILSHQEWSAIHSKDGPPIHDAKAQCYRWPDGALCPDELPKDDMLAMHVRREPATGDQLLIDRRRYWRMAVDIAEQEFNGAKVQFHEMALAAKRYVNLPPPPMDSKKILLDLRLNVFHARKELEMIEQAIADTPAAKRRQGILDQQAERTRSIAANAADFMEVSI